MDSEALQKYFESARAFHLEMPLYTALDLNDKNILDAVFNWLVYPGGFDAYCIHCNKETPFTTTKSLPGGPGAAFDGYSKAWKGKGTSKYETKFQCARCLSEFFSIYLIGNSQLRKVGQYPSTADMQVPQADKYLKILGKERLEEFKRGIGLAAHGIGIGSFVYLRRIIQSLIVDAKNILIEQGSDFDLKAYEKAEVKDQIKMVKAALPESFLSKTVLYPILSEGIHELSESECLEFILVIKLGIEQILDEKLRQKEREDKEAEVNKELNKIHSNLKNKLNVNELKS